MKYLFIASLTLTLSACSLFNSSTENEIGLSKKQLKEVAIIGDVGKKDGSLFRKDTHANSFIYANSFESITMALNASKGVQIDIQISRDSTLWLFGEETIRDCRFQEFRSLSEYKDETIAISSTCWYRKQLIPLDSFIFFMGNVDYKDKIISLDLQSITDPVALKLFGGEEKLTEIMAQKLNALNQLEDLTLIAELPTKRSIQSFKKESNFTAYLRIGGQKKIEDYSRLSVPTLRMNEVNQKKIETFQLWGVNTADDMLEGIKSDAKIIQTNDLDLADFVQNSTDLNSILLAKDSLNSQSDTLFSASLSEDQLKQDFMLQLTVGKGINLTGATLYIQGLNEDGHEVMWEGFGMQEKKNTYWNFINAEELKEKGCKQILVYIWSQSSNEKNLSEVILKQLTN